MDHKELEIYKTFVDDLVKISPGVYSKWIMGNGWPKTDVNEKINKLLSELTMEQKEVLSFIVQSARDGGIHDVLVYLTDQINVEGLEMTKNGVKMATESFGSEMYYDWVCRREGDSWPDSDE